MPVGPSRSVRPATAAALGGAARSGQPDRRLSARRHERGGCPSRPGADSHRPPDASRHRRCGARSRAAGRPRPANGPIGPPGGRRRVQIGDGPVMAASQVRMRSRGRNEGARIWRTGPRRDRRHHAGPRGTAEFAYEVGPERGTPLYGLARRADGRPGPLARAREGDGPGPRDRAPERRRLRRPARHREGRPSHAGGARPPPLAGGRHGERAAPAPGAERPGAPQPRAPHRERSDRAGRSRRHRGAGGARMGAAARRGGRRPRLAGSRVRPEALADGVPRGHHRPVQAPSGPRPSGHRRRARASRPAARPGTGRAAARRRRTSRRPRRRRAAAPSRACPGTRARGWTRRRTA